MRSAWLLAVSLLAGACSETSELKPDRSGIPLSYCDKACTRSGCRWWPGLGGDICRQDCTADWECGANEVCLCTDKRRCLISGYADESGLPPPHDACVFAFESMVKRRRTPEGG